MQMLQTTNLFSQAQHQAVRELLHELSPTEFRALALRFWGSYSLDDLSSDMNVDWDHANSILSRAMRRLKTLCLSHPAFAARLSKATTRLNLNEPISEKENQ
ncbi:MAG: sigma-70 family RNA polymerase sigma factor [Bdellovibrionaceae bacterium]|nr:sigma-70 family RNA polymerase sigma factor [Bdellovibrionales bacterium]MCB9254191.1 sigma-70 family RNA polymerase sigma factor [Pseudobdellovibrionaceae bacterium]